VGFPDVETQPDFPAIEQRVLQRWRDGDVFARQLSLRADGPLFRFYEGPPTANGRPGVHHVESRAFKDIFPRYRAMKGYRVPRKAGWDCHGLPVELEIERELGLARKQDIEDYGIEAFNAKCRESVTRYVGDWERLTERIGFWVDLSDAYWTMSTDYVESVWWSLKQLWDNDLIYQGHRVVPYCPRCGTALSDHEVAQGYDTATDPSVYVRFPLLDGPLADEGADLLVWTTTPWTLISNTAVAIGEKIRYVLARAAEGRPVVVAAELVEAALGEEAQILRDVAVSELLGLHYRGPFDYVQPDEGHDAWRSVLVGDFVSTDSGTGIVHLAPAFGEDDMRIARAAGLPVVNPVDLEGRFDARVTPWTGQFVKDADASIIEALREAGILHRAGTYEHTYPFCWRCKTPLLYYAKPSWYIRTTAIRTRLLEENAKVDWHPEHIRDGRYGDWLTNNIDWSLSRERYWGTPLPLWRCDGCDDVEAFGSRAELGARAGQDLSDLDPHRPYVDDVMFACACGGTKRRVPEVIDAWYDSGSMPFAQWGYPHAPGSKELFEERFPADYICEAIDQTRGWFYSLMATSTLLFDANSYRTVVCLGHIVDADGKKMSKSLGNILDPWTILDTRGADALRWLLLTDGSPWVARRVGPEAVDEVVRKFLLTLWNTQNFFLTYARIEGWTPAASAPPPVRERPVMDRWILAELAALVDGVDQALNRFDSTSAGRAITQFADDLSNWYVRRSRPRFWRTGPDDVADRDAAFSTLHECLVTVAALLAPFTPFTADAMWHNLVASVDAGAPDSVHLVDFPRADATARDDRLRQAMAAARRITELGRRARQDARIGVRQPLRMAAVTLPEADRAVWADIADVVAEELNVKHIELAEGAAGTVSFRLKPDFRALGKTFGPRTQAIAGAVGQTDADAFVAALRAHGSAAVLVDGDAVDLTAEQVQVIEEPRTGWQVASDAGSSVALDVALDDELRREGLARELVRTLNDLRKRQGLELTDRIAVEVSTDGALAEAITAHGAAIAADTLAVSLGLGTAEGGDDVEIGDARARVLLRRA
jgi:isoleucyl-tRNA synthetase